MIIVLKNADFSANNIGQVPIPINWDLDAKAYVDSFSTSISDSTKRQLNSLVIKLKEADLYGKLTRVIFPIFGAIDGGKNLKNSEDIFALPSGAIFDSNGMSLVKGFRLPGYTPDSGSIGVYNTEPISTISGGLSVSLAFNASDIDSGTSTGRAAGRAVTASGTQSALSIGSTVAERIFFSEVQGIGFIAVSTSSALVTSTFLASKSIGTKPFFTNSPVNPIIGGTSITTSHDLLESPIGCIFLGSYLTENELSLLGSIFDNFFDNLYQV